MKQPAPRQPGLDPVRRTLLASAGGLAAFAASAGLSSVSGGGQAQAAPSAVVAPTGRRKLGALEVSSLGLGVQNMSRTYQTTVPSRPEMINIIRTAYERSVTFYDAAEAYGPHEVERILGEGVAPFRDKVVVASKFGWDIDLRTGERRPWAQRLDRDRVEQPVGAAARGEAVAVGGDADEAQAARRTGQLLHQAGERVAVHLSTSLPRTIVAGRRSRRWKRASRR